MPKKVTPRMREKGTHLHGLHHWFCWSNPYLARHFFMLLPDNVSQKVNICWAVVGYGSCVRG